MTNNIPENQVFIANYPNEQNAMPLPVDVQKTVPAVPAHPADSANIDNSKNAVSIQGRQPSNILTAPWPYWKHPDFHAQRDGQKFSAGVQKTPSNNGSYQVNRGQYRSGQSASQRGGQRGGQRGIQRGVQRGGQGRFQQGGQQRGNRRGGLSSRGNSGNLTRNTYGHGNGSHQNWNHKRFQNVANDIPLRRWSDVEVERYGSRGKDVAEGVLFPQPEQFRSVAQTVPKRFESRRYVKFPIEFNQKIAQQSQNLVHDAQLYANHFKKGVSSNLMDALQCKENFFHADQVTNLIKINHWPGDGHSYILRADQFWELPQLENTN